MKKIVLSLITVMTFAFATAQEQGKFRVGLDLGYTIPSGGGGGILLSLEPKYNIKDNMNVGLRISSAAIAKNFTGKGTDLKADISANVSYLVTYDYYFKVSSSFVPYVGGGAGIYGFANLDVPTTIPSSNIDVKSAFGGLVRTGFETGKFRMGLEYNLVPKSNLQNVSGATIATAKNSYLGIHLGFYVGGGKWGRK